MAAWTDAEKFKLIELWSDNSQVYAKLSDQMHKVGYERTLVQCRDKVKKLKGNYRKIKDGYKQMGNDRKKFYEKKNEVMSVKHSVTPPLILDTSIANSVVENSNIEPREDDVEEIPETDLDDESIVSEKGTIKDGEVESAEKESNKENLKLQLGSQRKKSVKIDKMEKVVNLMCEKISSRQAESDRVYADLEEKRIKLEYDILAMQRDMQREQIERAERQKFEDTDFQLKLLGMLLGQHRSSAWVFGGQSSAPVFGGQNYFPSPSTYSAGNNDSGNSAYLSDNDYQSYDYNSQ